MDTEENYRDIHADSTSRSSSISTPSLLMLGFDGMGIETVLI